MNEHGCVLYVSPTNNQHDQRFLRAWRDLGFHAEHLQYSPSKSKSFSEELSLCVSNRNPDLIQVGPLPIFHVEEISIYGKPILGTSWGYDLLLKDSGSSAESDIMLAQSLTFLDWLLVDTQAGADEAQRLGFPDERISIFPWGVGDPYIKDPSLHRHQQISKNSLVFYTNRSHEATYNVKFVIESFIAAKNPNSKLLVGGSGSQTLQLKQYVAGQSSSNVIFVGHQVGDDLLSIYARSQFYVSASSVDGSSVSLLEAMAMGCVPIVPNIPGNVEWVGPTNGFLFSPNTDELSNLFSELPTMTESQIYQLGKAGRNAVLERAVWSKNVKQLALIFFKVTGIKK